MGSLIDTENLENGLPKKTSIVIGTNSMSELYISGFEVFQKDFQTSIYETDKRKLTRIIEDINSISVSQETSLLIYGHSLDLVDSDTLKIILNANFTYYSFSFYTDNEKKRIIQNLRHLFGVQKYNELFNDNRINYIDSSC